MQDVDAVILVKGAKNTFEMSDIEIVFDDKHFLDENCIGGVAIASQDERIVCNNTLEQRLNQALTISLPSICLITLASFIALS